MVSGERREPSRHRQRQELLVVDVVIGARSFDPIGEPRAAREEHPDIALAQRALIKDAVAVRLDLDFELEIRSGERRRVESPDPHHRPVARSDRCVAAPHPEMVRRRDAATQIESEIIDRVSAYGFRPHHSPLSRSAFDALRINASKLPSILIAVK
ncbi:MAG TPA: hypothetical protein VIP82_05185 [Microbacterium sp.]|uniref:hypothetical protein n=1 Tax=Microbacterium sp. TaxID=51671 RepID=UPI002F92589B